MLFLLKMKPENNNGNESSSRDLATKKWEPKHHDVLCSKHFLKKCFTDRVLLSIQFGLKYMSVGPQGN